MRFSKKGERKMKKRLVMILMLLMLVATVLPLVHVVARAIGDINCDGKVDMKDIGAVARAFGEFPGRPRWNPAYDVNGDRKIDMIDVALVARNIGWKPTCDP